MYSHLITLKGTPISNNIILISPVCYKWMNSFSFQELAREYLATDCVWRYYNFSASQINAPSFGMYKEFFLIFLILFQKLHPLQLVWVSKLREE